jgi:hypothetical protein
MTPCKQRQSTIEKLTAENARLTSLIESWKTHEDSLVRTMYGVERERDELRAENASLEIAVATYREEARTAPILANRARRIAQELLAELDRLKADLEARQLQRKIEAILGGELFDGALTLFAGGHELRKQEGVAIQKAAQVQFLQDCFQ